MSLCDVVGRSLSVTGAPPEDAPAIQLTILEIDQAEPVWCWAACILMVIRRNGMGAVHGLIDQCDVVSNQTGVNCCDNQNRKNPPCTLPLEPHRVGVFWKPFSMVEEHCDRLDYELLRQELENNRPVEVWLGDRTSCDPMMGSGHVVLVIGCRDDEDEPKVTIQDPNPRKSGRELPYQTLVNGMEEGNWVGTWTNLPSV